MIRTHKRDEARLTFEGQPAWVSTLVTDQTDQAEGAMLKSLDGPYACSPDEHFTDDYGETFYKMESYIGADFGMVKNKREVVTDSNEIERLKDLWIQYQRDRGWPVFCP